MADETSVRTNQPACILVPLDGSRLAESSLSYARLFSQGRPCRVELMMVQERGDTRATHEEMLTYLEARAHDLRSKFSIDASCDLELGIPFLAILEEARSEDVSLIVISTHGHTGPGNFRLGSVTDKVVRDARCPILVVGTSGLSSPSRLQRILVPLDGSELAEVAIPMARGIATDLGPMIEFVRVADPDRSAGDDAAAYLQAVAESMPAGVFTKQTVLEGSPAETLRDYAQKTKPDLLVMSSHGAHGFFSYALGSVTDRLLGGPIPLLIVRPGHLPRIKALFEAAS